MAEKAIASLSGSKPTGSTESSAFIWLVRNTSVAFSDVQDSIESKSIAPNAGYLRAYSFNCGSGF
jgi:hypothetical protein